MRSFQAIGGYFSAAKEKIKCKVQSFWQRDGVQATYQGLTAPIYSRASFQNLVSSSQGLQTSLSRAVTENATYALRALILYFVYYRMINPTLQEYQDELDSSSWIAFTAGRVISGIDATLFWSMTIYLMTYGWQSSAQNILLTSTITTTAGNAMKPSPGFKKCDPKECGAVTVARAGLDSAFFYLANRYAVSFLSGKIENSVPGLSGKALAFGLEAVSIGLPLVEYKFSAVGQCTLHKYKEMLGSYKAYCVMYGVSFVAVTWGSYKILSAISGEKNPYIYDAVFSLMFQIYVVLSIARETKLPGNDRVTFDVVKWLTYFAKQPLTQSLLTILLGPLSSIEQFVQSPGAGAAISVYDNEFKQGINSVKGGIRQARDIQNSRIVTTMRWVNTWFPYQFIPQEVTTACQSVSKTTLSRFLRKIEYLLELGRTAEIERTPPQVQEPIVIGMIGDHFALPESKFEQEDKTTALPMLQVTEPYLPRFGVVQIDEVKPKALTLQIESKIDVPKEQSQPAPPVTVTAETKDKPTDQKLDAIFQTKDIIVDSGYFVESKDKEIKKMQSPLPHSQRSSTLFARNESGTLQRMPRKRDSLVSVPVSIISNVVRAKALR